MLPLLPLPPAGTPIRTLERLWLETSCAYAQLDETMMDDTAWDRLAVDLWHRRTELSPYFAHSLKLPWPVPLEGWDPGENPLKTAMGVDWEKGLPAIVLQELRLHGVPKRMSLWHTALKALQAPQWLTPVPLKDARP